ncbi:MAG: aminotransferase class I/II-fold pyridoxal phosphate-dependent enzyme [Opitutales bacterium]|nr:aminotransferase class I/II-fold pyridoxal phosphate-dependent enzyme [Opitutales bacterium]
MDTAEVFAKKFFSNRIGGENFGKTSKIYKFEKIKRAKRAAMNKYPDRTILDMGIGEPDVMADQIVIQTLFDEANKFENRGYADNGCYEFKVAIASYMKQMFHVELDPDKEILHSIGSKSALSILPLCFINPGDTVLMTVPGYGVFGTHAKYLGADIVNLPLCKKNKFLPEIETLSPEILQKTKLLVLNYPNNPTGAICTRDFYSKVVEFAHKYNFLIIADAAYSALTFDPNDRLSILQIDSAKEVALELHSMSKGFNMTGWRIGWVCGNEYLIRAYGNVKDNTDSGQFLPIQKAAAKILGKLDIPQNNASRYSRRMDKVIEIFNTHGMRFEKPKAGFFIYSNIPSMAVVNKETFSFQSAEQFSEWAIEKLGIILVPWDDADHAIRLSMTFTTPDMNEEQMLNALEQRLLGIEFLYQGSHL